VDFAADLYHVHAARTQYVPQQVPSRPVHIVNRELETRAGDGIQVGEPGNRLDIGGLQVGFLDRGSPAFRHGASANFRLDLLYHRGTRRAAEFLLELDSVPAPGIVAGSDGDAAGSADMLDRIRNRRSRNGVVRQANGNTGLRNHLREGLGKAARSKTGVVADDDPASWIFILENVRGDGARHPAHVFESEVVGDDAAPSVGSELDLRRHLQMLLRSASAARRHLSVS